MSRSSSASSTTVAGAGLNISSSSSSSRIEGTGSRSVRGSMTRASRLSLPLPPILSNPAAMTVTRTSSPRASSMVAPKMMFASG